MSGEKQIEEIKDHIDSIYGCDCAYYGVDGIAIATELYNVGYRKQSDKLLVKENGDIVNLSAQSEWISVDERLPEENVRVLVYRNSDRSYTKIDTDRLIGGKWVRWSEDVTHWMLLPEPPNNEKGR